HRAAPIREAPELLLVVKDVQRGECMEELVRGEQELFAARMGLGKRELIARERLEEEDAAAPEPGLDRREQTALEVVHVEDRVPVAGLDRESAGREVGRDELEGDAHRLSSPPRESETFARDVDAGRREPARCEKRRVPSGAAGEVERATLAREKVRVGDE